LARAHGGTLTTNPDTGLPEAGFLRAILPMVAGAALGPAGLGLTAMQAGLATAALGTVATGNLGKGLMAGLGAYGGAGLMGSVAGAGAGAMNEAATQGILNANPGQVAASGTFQPAITPSEIAREMGSLNPATGTFQPAAGFVQPEIAVNANPATASTMDKFGAGIKAIGDKPELLFNKGNLGYGLAAAAPLVFKEPEKRAGYEGGGANPYQYEYDPGRQTYTASSGSSEQAYFRPRYNMMADGGLAALSGGGASHLGDYSDGGRLLRGPGDGVSDDIPATIANKRPARLADGEFVVPARIVSELGNGSTEAGARKLYAMMDRVQKNRSKTVGKNKVAVDSRSEKLLPA
jgi:hypothetical protein